MSDGTPPTRRLVLAAAGVLLLPCAAGAQPMKRRRIATLAQGSRASGMTWEAFWQGLRALGYGDQELAIESRWADGYVERLPGLAAELVQLASEVIVVGSFAAARATKQATATIPIVVTASNDPMGAGLVASIAHPGGNVTGLSTMHEEIAGKQLELLRIAVPRAERIAVLVDPGNPSHAGVFGALQQAARTLGTGLLSVEVHAPDEIDGAFATMAHERGRLRLCRKHGPGGHLQEGRTGQFADLVFRDRPRCRDADRGAAEGPRMGAGRHAASCRQSRCQCRTGGRGE
jgi:ABC-type uncharacterized transport system substrate-binding protein